MRIVFLFVRNLHFHRFQEHLQLLIVWLLLFHRVVCILLLESKLTIQLFFKQYKVLFEFLLQSAYLHDVWLVTQVIFQDFLDQFKLCRLVELAQRISFSYNIKDNKQEVNTREVRELKATTTKENQLLFLFLEVRLFKQVGEMVQEELELSSL